MPTSFPETKFREFALAARAFFPDLKTFAGWEEMLYDPQEKHRQFDWSWQAVRYRYRSCTECNDEFKALLNDEASGRWKAGGSDEELVYKLERCIYQFFTSALSVFDSFAFCLYFYGNALEPKAFPEVGNPRAIKRSTTAKAFMAAFPQAAITGLMAGLSKDSRFGTIDIVRNLVGHRISGRRSVRASTTMQADGTYSHWREETWHLPGTEEKLTFDAELLQRQLDNITSLLAELSSAAREFAVAQKAVRKPATEPQT